MTKLKTKSPIAKAAVLKPTLLSLAVAHSLALNTAHAATINVTCALDTDCLITEPIVLDLCSLREAITSMNNGALEDGCVNSGDAFGTNDTILSAALAQPTSSALAITTNDPLTINLGGSTITGSGTHPIFGISNTPNLTLENMTVTGGSASVGGGGIRIENSNVTISQSTISGNSSSPGGGGGINALNSSLALTNSRVTNNFGYQGGGIATNGDSGLLEVNNSTIDANRGTFVAGIYVTGGSANITNSTLSGNSAQYYGGLRVQRGATANLNHTTIADNIDSGNKSSAIYVYGSAANSLASVTISNSVISGSNSCYVSELVGPYSFLIDQGGNWFEDNTCNGVAQGDPRLGALADNGGPTQTHLPSIASPLRNFATSNCAATDQRGNTRGTPACDAGAVEFINAEIVVDSQTDNGAGCTLRDAILSTSSATLQAGCASDKSLDAVEGRSILFDPSLAGETITLNGTELLINNGQKVEMNPSGVSGITIDGNHSSRILNIYDSTVSINSLSIENGFVPDIPPPYGGAGIRASGSSVYLLASTVRNNTAGATGVDSKGGGISVLDGYLMIDSSSISSNSSGNLGGGMYLPRTKLAMVNSTISGNKSSASGAEGFFIFTDEPLISVINNSTINDNLRVQKDPNQKNLILQNSIINGSCYGVSPNIIDDGGNIFKDASCGTTAQGDPGLMPLADNGGPTQTHALKENSIARNAGVFGLCPLFDQRGNLRDEGDAKCDAGAFELLDSDIPVNFIVIPLKSGGTVTIPL